MYHIPITEDGDLHPVTPTMEDIEDYNIKSIQNYEFKSTITFDCFIQIKGIIMVKFTDSNNNIMYMMLYDLEKVIKKGNFNNGVINGNFKFKKTKDYYSIYKIGG